MNQDIDKNKKVKIDKKLPASGHDSKESVNKLPDAIHKYNKIVEKRKKSKESLVNFLAALVCILVFLLVFLNVYMVETKKYEQNILKIQQEEIARKKQEELDKIKLQIAQKDKESADLVIFNDKYLLIRKDFYDSIETLAIKADNKLISIEDIIKITEDRIKLAEDYKSKINAIAIPAQLTNFYKYELEFLDSDIILWRIANAYYELDDLSKFNTDKIYEESIKSHTLFLKAQEELKNIYSKYELDYFLKDIIINYK